MRCRSWRGLCLNAASSYGLRGLSTLGNYKSGNGCGSRRRWNGFCQWNHGRHCISGRSWCRSSGSLYGYGLNRGSSVASGYLYWRNGGGLSHGYYLRGGGYSLGSGCCCGRLYAGSWYLRGSHGRNFNCFGSTYCHHGSRSTRGSACARRSGYACGLPCCIRWYAPLNRCLICCWPGALRSAGAW